MSRTKPYFPTPSTPDQIKRMSVDELGVEATPRLTNETLRLWKAFAPLASEQRRWALAVGTVTPAQPGDRFRSEGQVTVVVSGCLATQAAGSELTAEILGPGDVIATGAADAVTGRWITAGEVYRLGLEDWLDRAGTKGLIHLLDASHRRRAVLEQRLVCATRHLATARVADLFLSINKAAPGLGILLSQEQLGGMLGLRRTTVNGSCRALELAGGSRTGRKKIRILDPGRLMPLACGCHGAG